MEAIEKFRIETREWLEANCLDSMRTPQPENEVVWGGRNASFKNPDSKVWLERMAERGWTAPMWPKQYGGGGLNKAEFKILREEMAALKCRSPLASFGLSMLGPVLLEFADEHQKMEHLPKIVKGEIRWCQGYSEPGSGSDLAGLQTRAEDMGDHYLVNGQKVWTSYANHADWIFCLVRTDPTAKKQSGISFLLFDMNDPGVETRPIKLISGSSPFCEVFFDNVKVPKRNLVGQLNGGWTIAKRLWEHERAMISDMWSETYSLEGLAKEYLGEQDEQISDPLLRDRIAQLNMNTQAFQLTLDRATEELKSGKGPGAASAMFKLYGTEQNKSRYEILISSLGAQSLGWSGDGFSRKELGITREWLRSRANSIEGGTSEVQLNIIAKRVLNLLD